MKGAWGRATVLALPSAECECLRKDQWASGKSWYRGHFLCTWSFCCPCVNPVLKGILIVLFHFVFLTHEIPAILWFYVVGFLLAILCLFQCVFTHTYKCIPHTHTCMHTITQSVYMTHDINNQKPLRTDMALSHNICFARAPGSVLILQTGSWSSVIGSHQLIQLHREGSTQNPGFLMPISKLFYLRSKFHF